MLCDCVVFLLANQNLASVTLLVELGEVGSEPPTPTPLQKKKNCLPAELWPKCLIQNQKNPNKPIITQTPVDHKCAESAF